MAIFEVIFLVNDCQVRIQQRKPGVYWGIFEGVDREYQDAIDAHKEVLMRFLGDLLNEGMVDAATANWPKNKITILN